MTQVPLYKRVRRLVVVEAGPWFKKYCFKPWPSGPLLYVLCLRQFAFLEPVHLGVSMGID